jgi:hypothetical protein
MRGILHSYEEAHEVSDSIEDFQTFEEYDYLGTVILLEPQMSKGQLLADKCEEHELQDQALQDQATLQVCPID